MKYLNMFLSVVLLFSIGNILGMEVSKQQEKKQEISDSDISGLDKKEVLRALYKWAQPQSKIFLFSDDYLTDTEVEQALSKRSIDYIKDRAMKINLHESPLDTRLYNENNGHRTAEWVIANLKAKKTTNSTRK